MELSGVGFVILFLVGFFSSSDSTGGSVDTVDEDGPWDETEPLFYEVHDDAMDCCCYSDDAFPSVSCVCCFCRFFLKGENITNNARPSPPTSDASAGQYR